MATVRIPVLGAVMPDPAAAGAVYCAPFSVLATNDVWKSLVAIFNETAARQGLHFRFVVPSDYVGSGKFVVVWSTSAITGDAVWDIDYRTVAGNDTTSLDQTGNEESLTVSDTAPGAAWRRLEAILTTTAANFVGGEEVTATLFRDGTDATDTLAAAAPAVVFEVLFEYVNV